MEHKLGILFFIVILLAFKTAPRVSIASDNEQQDKSGKGLPDWIAKEKIRAGYLYISNDPEYAKLLKKNGLNTVIVKGALHRKEETHKTVDGYRRWARAGGLEGLRIFLAYNWQPEGKTWQYRKVVYSEGNTGIAPCPRDRNYWQDYMTSAGEIISKLSLEQGAQVDGIFLDTELYGSGRRGYPDYARNCCFCDNCFSSFLLNRGYTAPNLPPIGPADRKKWLQKNRLLDNYFTFLQTDVESLSRKYEQKLHLLNPELLLGMYPTPKDWVRESICKGLGMDNLPMIIFATDTYEGGGHRRIPNEPAKLYKNAGIDALYVAGFLLRRYSTDRLGVNLYAAAEKCSGYWLFRMPMLWGKFSGTETLAFGSTEEYWQSIKIANSDIDVCVAENYNLKGVRGTFQGWKLLNPKAAEREEHTQKIAKVNFRGIQEFLFYGNRQQKVEIGLHFQRLAKYRNNLEYEVITPEGDIILNDTVSKQGRVVINFNSKVTGVHLLKVDVGRCMFRIESSNTPIAALDTSGFNTISQTDPLYFYISNTSEKLVILGDGEGKETFRITIENPKGKKLTADTTIARNNFRLGIEKSSLEPGIWNLSIGKNPSKKLEDAHFNFVGSGKMCLAFKPKWIFIK